MPIGWERGDGSVVHRPAQQPSVRFVERVAVLAQRVVANVSGGEPTRTSLAPVVWTRWAITGDERVCPVCRLYAGRAWPIDSGPRPPLHHGCRCARVYSHTTWQVRGS